MSWITIINFASVIQFAMTINCIENIAVTHVFNILFSYRISVCCFSRGRCVLYAENLGLNVFFRHCRIVYFRYCITCDVHYIIAALQQLIPSPLLGLFTLITFNEVVLSIINTSMSPMPPTPSYRSCMRRRARDC